MGKICIKCARDLPCTSEYFYVRKDSEDGFKNTCKECGRIYNNKYRKENYETIKKYKEENSEKIREQNKKHNEKRKEAVSVWHKKNRAENRDKLNDKWKAYYIINYENIKKHRETYYKENREKILLVDKKRREANKGKIAEYNKKYRIENIEKVYNWNNIRKSNKNKLESSLTHEQWNNIKAYFNNTCAYCGEEKPLTREHFIALSKNGEYSNNNIICACGRCNSSKKAKDFFEWYPKQKYYSEQREKKILKYLNYNKNNTQQLSIL